MYPAPLIALNRMMVAAMSSRDIDAMHGLNWAGRHEYRVAEAQRAALRRAEDAEIASIMGKSQ